MGKGKKGKSKKDKADRSGKAAPKRQSKPKPDEGRTYG